MARLLFLLLAWAHAASTETEECPLLQTAVHKEEADLDEAIPAGRMDGLELLTSEDWALAKAGTELAWSTYFGKQHTRPFGRLLKEVSVPEPGTRHPFLMARLIRATDGKCWVAFRGTVNDAGWRMNHAVLDHQETVKAVTGDDVWVASSWLKGYRLLERGLKSAIQVAYKKKYCKPDSMYLTGHSMGGVMASYAALLDLVGMNGHHAQGLVTAGAPRPWITSPEQCERLSQNLVPHSFRFVRYSPSNGKAAHDPVPSTPRATFAASVPTTHVFHHCAAKDVALYAADEQRARVKCQRGWTREQCKVYATLHGLLKLPTNDPPFQSLKDGGDTHLHDITHYKAIVEMDAFLHGKA